MTENAIQKREVFEPTIEDMRARMEKLEASLQLMRRGPATAKGSHFGPMPGTQGDVLFKAGAEWLMSFFALVPDYEVTSSTLTNELVRFVITCRLMNSSGQIVGSGLGACSTREKKWKGQAAGGALQLEHTMLVMAGKRAMVQAVLQATGASSILTQEREVGAPDSKQLRPTHDIGIEELSKADLVREYKRCHEALTKAGAEQFLIDFQHDPNARRVPELRRDVEALRKELGEIG